MILKRLRQVMNLHGSLDTLIIYKCCDFMSDKIIHLNHNKLCSRNWELYCGRWIKGIGIILL